MILVNLSVIRGSFCTQPYLLFHEYTHTFAHMHIPSHMRIIICALIHIHSSCSLLNCAHGVCVCVCACVWVCVYVYAYIALLIRFNLLPVTNAIIRNPNTVWEFTNAIIKLRGIRPKISDISLQQKMTSQVWGSLTLAQLRDIVGRAWSRQCGGRSTSDAVAVLSF